MTTPKKTFLLFVSSLLLASAAPCHAERGRKYRLVTAAEHDALVAKFRDVMADEIEAVGAFRGKPRDTPVGHLVPMRGKLIQTRAAAVDFDHEDIYGEGRAFAFYGLKQPAKVKLLIPVSAHDELPYREYAVSNRYNVWVENELGEEVSHQLVHATGFGKQPSEVTRHDLVTEAEVTLPFDKGKRFVISFAAEETRVDGFASGRQLTVKHAGR